MKDEIITEVWRNRDALAERYGHSLDAIVAAMRKRERHPLTPLVKQCRVKPPPASAPARRDH